MRKDVPFNEDPCGYNDRDCDKDLRSQLDVGPEVI